jgi:hypothetical protein
VCSGAAAAWAAHGAGTAAGNAAPDSDFPSGNPEFYPIVTLSFLLRRAVFISKQKSARIR